MSGNAKIISKIPMYPRMTVQEVNKLCREKKLFGYKLKDANFEPWIITPESFSLYLKYRPLIGAGFLAADPDEVAEAGDDVTEFVHEVFQAFSINWTEGYKIKELALIFNEPWIRTLKRFHPRFTIFHSWCVYLTGDKNIDILKIVQYLTASPHAFEYLRIHHIDLLYKNSDEEPLLRYILMRQMYYATYGHLN